MGEQNSGLQPRDLWRGTTDWTGELATESQSPRGEDPEATSEVDLSQIEPRYSIRSCDVAPGKKVTASGFKLDNKTAAGRNVGASGLSTILMAARWGRLEAHLSIKGHTWASSPRLSGGQSLCCAAAQRRANTGRFGRKRADCRIPGWQISVIQLELTLNNRTVNSPPCGPPPHSSYTVLIASLR